MPEITNTGGLVRPLNTGTVDVVSFFQEAAEGWHSVTSLVTLGKPPHPWAPQFPYLEKGIIKTILPTARNYDNVKGRGRKMASVY